MIGKDAAERFWARVNKTERCWLWTGRLRKGYGVMGVNKRLMSAHRVSYELNIGPIPPGMLVCHMCDVANCVRPGHLFVGTSADNEADKIGKGRHSRTMVPVDVQAAMIDAIRAGESYSKIGARFGFCGPTVSATARRHGIVRERKVKIKVAVEPKTRAIKAPVIKEPRVKLIRSKRFDHPKRPVGHPELPPDKRRTVTLRTRVTRSEAATVRDKRPAWEKIRGRYGSESEFLRDVLLS